MKLTSPSCIYRSILAFAAVPSLCFLVAGASILLADEKPSKAGAPGAQPTAGAESEKQQGDRLISIVLLLKAPHDMTHEEIAHAISEGTGTKVTEADVVSKPPYHLVTIGSDKYIVNNVAEPYFKDVDKLAAEIKQHTLGEAVQQSKAWLSVDWVGKDDKTDIRPVYQMIGKMATHLATHFAATDTVAAYSPDMDEFALWTPEVKKGLQSDDPLAVFDQGDKTADAPKTSSGH
jgi:hypothetical protein